jgi:glycine/D-amino acid oxidase-like deaminating enzyme
MTLQANLYSDDMYRFDQPEPSYWEATAGRCVPHTSALTEDAKCEVAIIGGGYTGLSAAYHLCRDYQIDTRVLEAGHIGWGASGRNGGFCSMGGTSLGAAGLLKRYGVEHTRHYYQAQLEAVELVRSIILDEEIDSPIQGDSEIEIACSPGAFAALKNDAEMQYRVLGIDTSVLTREQVREQCFDMPIQHGAMVIRPTFGLHPVRYVRGLADAAVRRGAILHDRSQVIEWQKNGPWHVLRTGNAVLRAKKVIVATNGFMPEHLHAAFHGKTLPLISSIVVTRPLSDAELGAHYWRTESPTITSLDLLDYFRVLPDKRLLLGGRGSADGSVASAQVNFGKLARRVKTLFPQWHDAAIDYRWQGLVCLTRRLTPAVGRLDEDPSTFFAFGYHGNGVNSSTWCGKFLADWLGHSKSDDRRIPDMLPLIMRRMPGGIPLPSLRLHYVQARIAAFRLTDWWHNRK